LIRFLPMTTASWCRSIGGTAGRLERASALLFPV
jgi:hypothetical protein